MGIHEIDLKEFNSEFNPKFLPETLLLSIKGVMFNVCKKDCKVVLKGSKKYLSIPSPIGTKTILLPLAFKNYKLSTLEVLKLMQGQSITIKDNIFAFYPLEVYDNQKRKEIGAIDWRLDTEDESNYLDFWDAQDVW